MSENEPLISGNRQNFEKEPLRRKPYTILAMVAIGVIGVGVLIGTIVWRDARGKGAPNFADDISAWGDSQISIRTNCAKATANQVGRFYAKCLDNFSGPQCLQRVKELKALLCPYLHCRAQYEIIVPGYIHCLKQRNFHHCFQKANYEMDVGCANHNDLKRRKQVSNHHHGDHELCDPKYTNDVAVFYEDCLGWNEYAVCTLAVGEMEKLICPQRCSLQYSLVIPQFKRCVQNHGTNCYAPAARNLRVLCPADSDNSTSSTTQRPVTTTSATTSTSTTTTTTTTPPPRPVNQQTTTRNPSANIQKLVRKTKKKLKYYEHEVHKYKKKENELIYLEHEYSSTKGVRPNNKAGYSCSSQHSNEIKAFGQKCLYRFGMRLCRKRADELKRLVCRKVKCSERSTIITPNFKSCALLFGIPECFIQARKELNLACPQYNLDHRASDKTRDTSLALSLVQFSDLKCVRQNANALKGFYLSCLHSGNHLHNTACMNRVNDLAGLMCPVLSACANQKVVVKNYLDCVKVARRPYKSCYDIAHRELALFCPSS